MFDYLAVEVTDLVDAQKTLRHKNILEVFQWCGVVCK